MFVRFCEYSSPLKKKSPENSRQFQNLCSRRKIKSTLQIQILPIYDHSEQNYLPELMLEVFFETRSDKNHV